MLLVANVMPSSFVFLFGLAIFWLSGILDDSDALSGFSNPGVLLVASSSVISRVLEFTRVYKFFFFFYFFFFYFFFFISLFLYFLFLFLDFVSWKISNLFQPQKLFLFFSLSLKNRYLFTTVFLKPKGIRLSLCLLLPFMMVVSAFINESAVSGALTNTVVVWGLRSRLSIPQVLLPMLYAILLGSTLTLIGLFFFSFFFLFFSFFVDVLCACAKIFAKIVISQKKTLISKVSKNKNFCTKHKFSFERLLFSCSHSIFLSPPSLFFSPQDAEQTSL